MRPSRFASDDEDSPGVPMSKRSIAALLLLAIAFTFPAIAQATEKKITRDQLPEAVQKAVDAQSHGATIRGFSEEVEHDQTFYEAEMTVNGHTKDVLFDATGKVAEIEEEVSFDSLPAAVKIGLQAKVGRAKLGKVESLTKHDTLVAYEAKVVTNGKKSEIQVGPDGKPLDHEE